MVVMVVGCKRGMVVGRVAGAGCTYAREVVGTYERMLVGRVVGCF